MRSNHDPHVHDYNDLHSEGPIFSVLSLVNKPDLYETLLKSFKDRGFDSPHTEYIYIDNSQYNQFDAYNGLGALIHKAKGKYLILCHQDVRCLEHGFDDLLERLESLDEAEPLWALAGNAGRDQKGNPLMCISDRFGAYQRVGTLPCETVSLDENFIVLKKKWQLAPSADLKGWHLYGTDLCLQAQMRGLKAFVIDFHLLHESGALRIDQSYFDCLEALEDKYNNLFRTRTIHTTCLSPTLSANPLWQLWSRLKHSRKKWRAAKKYGRA
jgi:hypothetical protein